MRIYTHVTLSEMFPYWSSNKSVFKELWKVKHLLRPAMRRKPWTPQLAVVSVSVFLSCRVYGVCRNESWRREAAAEITGVRRWAAGSGCRSLGCTADLRFAWSFCEKLGRISVFAGVMLPVSLFIFTKILQDKFLKKIHFYSSPKGDKCAT